MTSRISRLGWMALVMSLASQSAAFHHSVQEPFAIRCPQDKSHDSSTSMYWNVINPSRSSRVSFSVPTRLHYRKAHDEASSVLESSRTASNWWSSIFSLQESSPSEQDSVDEYLEFLDRRYRRLHSENEEDETVKPLSAINRLLQGNPSRNDVLATEHQAEDSLHVLGVAGLASEKLLQKHQLVSENDAATVDNSAALDFARNKMVVNESKSDSTSSLFIKKAVAPMQRLFLSAKLRRDCFVNNSSLYVRNVVFKALQALARSLIHGPPAAANALLEIGGGKKTLALTITIVTSVFFLFRPMLQAAMTEVSV